MQTELMDGLCLFKIRSDFLAHGSPQDSSCLSLPRARVSGVVHKALNDFFLNITFHTESFSPLSEATKAQRTVSELGSAVIKLNAQVT